LPEPYNNLAVLYASQGRYELARNALEMAIRTHPDYATAHENLGDIYAKMAAIEYGKVLALDNGNQAAQTRLKLIQNMLGGQATKSAGKPVSGSAQPTKK
ncbi:MAG: tetratricopeptide repeat protein, partial [Proteobacteria bacterium]|nr:tetratricopeptide repeat protein [Pseudomonadota bacterium]